MGQQERALDCRARATVVLVLCRSRNAQSPTSEDLAAPLPLTATEAHPSPPGVHAGIVGAQASVLLARPLDGGFTDERGAGAKDFGHAERDAEGE